MRGGFRKLLGTLVALAGTLSVAMAQSEPPPLRPLTPARVIERIQLCLADGSEVILHAQDMWCVPFGTWSPMSYCDPDAADESDLRLDRTLVQRSRCTPYGTWWLTGRAIFKEAAPTWPDDRAACNDLNDLRRLPAGIVKTLVADKDHPVAPSGIRIFGAVFCDMLDLAGVELPYSLVLDHALFARGIEARNFRTRGDFSVDQSLVFSTFRLVRAHVDGTVFATEGYIHNLRVLDTEVRGSVLLRDSLLGGAVQFDGLKLGSELSFRGSALSFLAIQFSQIGGVLDLSDSEARCGYYLKKNEIGELTAARFGFGTVSTVTTAEGRQREVYDWRKMADHEVVGPMLKRPQIRSATDGLSDCGFIDFKDSDRKSRTSDGSSMDRDPTGEFVLFDNRIRSSLCIMAFDWLTGPANAPRKSYLSLSYTTVGNHIILNLTPRAHSPTKKAPSQDLAKFRTFEAIGLEARTLLLNFQDNGRPYGTFVDGLKFDRVYSADVGCPDRANNSGSLAQFFGTKGAGPLLPNTEEVSAWLAKNLAKTIQPFTAFIEAFERAGLSAKKLRIVRADRDLEIDREIWLTRFVPPPQDPSPAATSSANPNVRAESMFGIAADWFALSLRWFWGIIADYGYEPTKVLPIILGIIVWSGIFFWFRLGIIGFRSENGSIRPVGFLFLFDRLIPVYNIRAEHYRVAAYYRRVPKNRGALSPDTPAPVMMKYLWFRLPVTEADERRSRQAESVLDMLKLMGVFLAVFLVAAVNALVSH